jgi:hypothetical protein
MKNFWDDVEIIAEYSRSQAIEDGALIDVSSSLSMQKYFNVPAVITETVQAELLKYNETIEDLCTLFFKYATPQNTNNSDRVVIDWHGEPLIWHIGPGDTDSPVLTIMRSIDD